MNTIKKILLSIFLFVISLGIYHTGYSQAVDTLTNGLVGYWKFDSISTLTTPDESGAGNVGTVGTSSRLVSGKFGQALRLDMGGSQQFMTTRNNFGSSQWSVSTWINPELPIATTSPYLGSITFFSADQSSSGSSQMLLITKDDIRTYQTKIANYSFANNPGWRHVVVTYNGTTLTVYVDGVSRGTLAYSNILANNIKRYIGTNSAQSRGHIFVGAIDETRLYSRVLTAAEISALFNNQVNVVTTTPTPVATTTPRIATTTTVAPQVLAPAIPVPTTKITTSFTATTNKTTYKLGDTVRMSATVTLDSAWVNYLKTVKGDTKAEVFFEIKDTSTNAFLVQAPIAFDLVNTSVTKTYDWVTPATNTALAGKTFSASFTVRDASKAVTEIKIINGLAFEALPVVVVPTLGVTNDGATVIEANVPAGTSPDIFAGVLATQQYTGNQFNLVRNTTTAFTTATTSAGLFPLVATKTAVEGTFGQYRLTTGSTMNLSGYNVVDFVLENNANTPIELILQAIGDNDSNYYQAVHLLPARSGARHILLPLEANLFKCNSVTGTDDCPLSPRQGVVKGGYVIGAPSKTNIREFRVRANNMPQNSTLVLHSMKAMNISYAPQYLRNYIDKYGQNNWVNFPEKITSDEQLKSDAQAERTTLRPLPNEWDMYGGDKTATGYTGGKFSLTKVDGKWWLVNPLGNLTYLTAVTQVDYTLTPGYVGDTTSAKRGAYVFLDRTGLFSNAFKDNVACHGNGVFCGGTTWSAYTSNIIRKYETPGITFPQIVEKWRLNQANRLREWGFNSITDRYAEYVAGWQNGVREIPFITQFNLKGKTSYKKVPGTSERVPDPFDPAFETEVNTMMSRYFNTKYPGTNLEVKNDPYAIGTAPDNEIPWGIGQFVDVNSHTRETSFTDVYLVVLRVLEQGASQPAKVAFTNLLKEKYGAQNFQVFKAGWGSVLPSNINSWETFQNNRVAISSINSNIRADLSFLLKEFALKYLRTTKAAIKTHGGEAHLFTGVRFAGFYRSPREVIDACAEVCDVISINYYDYTTDNTQTNRNNWAYLLAKDKPVLITEFYFDAPSRGSAIADRTQTTTDEDQGKAYEAYARNVLSKPQIIGYSYHDFYDQPLLGSIWTENNLTGFVSETDRPYPKLVESAKDINFDVYRIRGSKPNGNAQTVTLTVAKIGDGTVTATGINCGTDCTETVNVGTNVTLTATPATGYTFTGWSVCTGTGTCTVSMNTTRTATATFTRINTAPSVQPVTVSITGATAAITLVGSDPEGDALTYTVGTPTRGSLTRNSEGRYTYTITGPLPATAFTDTFNYYASDGRLTASAARVTVNYTPSTYVLTTTKTGNGTITGTQIDCGADCTGTYNANTVVTLTATPATGNAFSGWSGACTGTGTCSVTMNAAKTVTATFNPITYSVNVTKVGNGTVSGGTISCGATCQNVFAYGATVTLTATPAAGQTFTGWTGACTGAATCALTMNGNKDVTATFVRTNTAPTTYDLTFTIPSPGTTTLVTLSGTDPESDPLTFTPGTPTKGRLTRNPDGKYTYTITAPVPTTPFTDTFNYYASDGRLTSAASRVTINYTITPPAMFTLTVAKVGSGTVTAPGIACGGDCQGDFAKDTNAVLTATPATGYTFTGWSVCTGTGTCTIPMNTAKTVTATFTKINTAPVATAVNATVNTSGIATLTLMGTDIDGDTLVYTVGTPANGTLARIENGKYTYTARLPRPVTTTVDRFTYTVSDGRLTSAPATVAVTIPVLPNEPPIVLDTDLDGVIDSNDLCPNTPAALKSKVDAYGCPRPKISNFDIRPNTAGSLKNIVNAILGRNSVGQIKFNQPVDLVRDNAELDIDSNILITNKRVEVRATNVPELNKPATITLYGITEKNPKILRNGVECPPTQCVINSFENGVLTFTVNGF